jgi:cleavage and polyadenylation specificity factor subunit 1
MFSKGPNITWPMADTSALELMTSDTFVTMDGSVLCTHCRLHLLTVSRYEFAANEFITSVELVSLETQSNEAGYKEFIAVATTINRGEDLAVKGAVRITLHHPFDADCRGQVYIFDVAEVVLDATSELERSHKMRLVCRDEAKGPITALCGLNGYLVSSIGQKVAQLPIFANSQIIIL